MYASQSLFNVHVPPTVLIAQAECAPHGSARTHAAPQLILGHRFERCGHCRHTCMCAQFFKSNETQKSSLSSVLCDVLHTTYKHHARVQILTLRIPALSRVSPDRVYRTYRPTSKYMILSNLSCLPARVLTYGYGSGTTSCSNLGLKGCLLSCSCSLSFSSSSELSFVF
jgi:hypothetical protein